ncbi:hypothetical protein K501DRAFT_338484 [Backusella circina FSU 941]|nr:hypothetical protein K501DRAFT_338484 [Backusella circina FSU 941]
MSSHDENRDEGESSTSTYSARMLIPHSRRSTIIFSNVEQGGEPIENPNNPPQVNESLRREYNSIKNLNVVMEDVVNSVEGVAGMLKEYQKTVDQTESFLKLWKAILARAENTKAAIEANVAPPPAFKKPDPVKRKPNGFGTGSKRRRIVRGQT